MEGGGWTAIWLWLAVVASGLYHGVNPGMGWPLAVSAALLESSPRALLSSLWLLAAGHFLAMLVMLLPFALLLALAEWRHPIQLGASVLLIGYGVYRLIDRRHPRGLARIRPTQLMLWSFAVAIAHGAGLMLMPIYLGLCGPEDSAHRAAGVLMGQNLGTAIWVSIVHVVAMITAGGSIAWIVYRYLDLRLVSRMWFNLEVVWAVSLIAVGIIALGFNLATRL